MDKEVIIDIENPKDNDLISRQAVLDELRKAEDHAFNTYYKGLVKAHKIIADMPSAEKTELEPSYDRVNSDLISRWDLLDAFDLSDNTRKYGGDGRSGYRTLMLYEIQDIIEEMPSYSEMPNKSAEITWVTGADGAKVAFKDVPIDKVVKICEILGEDGGE